MAKSLLIDWTLCDGRGLCSELLPQIIGRDDWGYPLVRIPAGGERSSAVIKPEDFAAARDAVKLCPKLALRLLD